MNLVGVSSLVIIAVVAALGVAVGVIRVGVGGGGECSDDEFEDITLTASASVQQDDTISREGPSIGKNGKNTHGKDISWILLKEISNPPEFYSSDLAKKIGTSKRRSDGRRSGGRLLAMT